jgi:hypothetical protein
MRNNKSIILFFCLLMACAAWGCRIKKRQLVGGVSHLKQVEANNTYVNAESISFSRSEHQISGTVRFNTNVMANCEIEFWTKKNQNHPTKVPCKNKDPSQTFEEILTPIPYNENLIIVVHIWPSDLGPSYKRSFRIEENADLSKTLTKDLLVARVILPLKSVEIHEFRLDEPKNLPDLTATLNPPVGCQQKSYQFSSPYLPANHEPTITNLKASGFGGGAAVAHPYDTRHMMVSLDTLQVNLDWHWNFMFNSQENEMVTRPPAYIASVKLNNGSTSLPLKNKSLIGLDREELSDPVADLKFEWDPANFAEPSHVVIQLHGLNTGYYLSCVYPSSAKSAEIPPEQVQLLPTDLYELLVVMQSNQVQKPIEGSAPTWIISTQDWRYTKFQWTKKS